MTTTTTVPDRTDASVRDVPTPRAATPPTGVGVPAQGGPPAVESVPLPPSRAASRWPRRTRSRRAVRRRAVLDGIVVAVALGTVGVAGVAVALGSLLTAPEPPAPVAPASVSPNVSVPGRVLDAVDDGVWQIGVDVAPGTYTSAGPLPGTSCRHALRPARTGGNLTPTMVAPGPATVLLTTDDGWFATSGCATWRRVG